MSDLFGNHIVGFPTRRLKCKQYCVRDECCNVDNSDRLQHIHCTCTCFIKDSSPIFVNSGHKDLY